MKLNLSLTDERTESGPYAYSQPKTEEYERAAVSEAVGNRAVIAAILRGIADEIDPPRVNAASSVSFESSGVLR